MKRIATLVLAAGTALALNASTAQAQAFFGVGAGATIPTGDLADAVGTGWHGVANIGYDMASGLGLRGDFFYGQNSFSDIDDAKIKMAGFWGNVTYSFGGASAIKPYLIGTVGMTNSKASAGDFETESETDLTYGGGAGIKFGNMSGATFYVEGRYLMVSTDGDDDANFIPVSAGIRFSF